MTSKQLERKVNQLYSRKKLVETVESLEEAIKAFMLIEGKTEIHTEKFIISLMGGNLDLCENFHRSKPANTQLYQSQRKGGTYQ